MDPKRSAPCPCGSGKKFKKCCEPEGGKAVNIHRYSATPVLKAPSIAAPALEPSLAEINQLVALFNGAQFANLEASATRLLLRMPDSGFLWKALGLARVSQRKECLQALQKAAAFLPHDAEAHNALGGALRIHGQLDAALVSLRQAVALKPDYAAAHSNLGNALQDLGQLQQSLQSYRRALEIQPDFIEAYGNMGLTLFLLGQTEEGVACLRRALAMRPDAKFFSGVLFASSHNETVTPTALFDEHRRFGEQYEAPLRAHWPQHQHAQDPDRRLQVGFVSGDLRNHAVANCIEPLLVHLADSASLALHAFSNSVIEDAVTQRLRGYFAHWHAVASLSDEALAETIQANKIDILIDLSGHTGLNRLTAFARKPAPVQVSWIGYPGSTGLQTMDYYLADRFFLPRGQFDDQFIEKIVYLPATAPFLPHASAPLVNTLPALADGYITFGSFNRPTKLGRPVVALWSRLLRALPDARLLLANMPGDEKFDWLADWFMQEGIGPERLHFHARTGMDAYLGLHHQVDVCLDAFPYSGGTTTWHALWMGVPTLTMTGNTSAGRCGASILGQLGLDTFVAHDKEEFVQKGLHWANNLTELAQVRAGLRDRFAQSVAGQPEVLAAALEHAFRTMWQRWCEGLPTQSFEVV